jgi:hypothetical protein
MPVFHLQTSIQVVYGVVEGEDLKKQSFNLQIEKLSKEAWDKAFESLMNIKAKLEEKSAPALTPP